jgi:hypothetical protein
MRGFEMIKPIHCVLLLVAGMAACVSDRDLRPGASKPQSVTNAINLSGFPPEFRKGFTDGCSAARANEAPARPNAEGQYTVGWQDGHDYCKPKK